jgi:hypothetical protein
VQLSACYERAPQLRGAPFRYVALSRQESCGCPADARRFFARGRPVRAVTRRLLLQAAARAVSFASRGMRIPSITINVPVHFLNSEAMTCVAGERCCRALSVKCTASLSSRASARRSCRKCLSYPVEMMSFVCGLSAVARLSA